MQIKPITSGILILTNQCNLACPYCFEERAIETMSLDVAKQAYKFLQSNCQGSQKPHITFFGGEPLMEFNRVIVPLVEEYPDINYSMVTNGTLLTEDILQFFTQNRMSFMLSFDGLKSIQDTGRPMRNGKSSYDTIMKIWPIIRQYPVCNTIRSTLSKTWLNQLFNTILFVESLQIQSYRIFPNDWEVWGEEERKVLQQELQKYEEYIIKSFRSNQVPLIFFNYGNNFSKIKALQNIKGRREGYPCTSKYRCGIGIKGFASIETNGDLFSCHRITPLVSDSDWCIGNIYDGINTEKIEKLFNRYNKEKIGNENCSSCFLDPLCEGGCVSNNLMILGDMNLTPKTYCIWNQELLLSAYRVAKALGEEENELFRKHFLRWCSRGF